MHKICQEMGIMPRTTNPFLLTIAPEPVALFMDGVNDRVCLPYTILDGRYDFTYNIWYRMEESDSAPS